MRDQVGVEVTRVHRDLRPEPGWPLERLALAFELDFRDHESSILAVKLVDLPDVRPRGHPVAGLVDDRLVTEPLEHRPRVDDAVRTVSGEWTPEDGSFSYYPIV